VRDARADAKASRSIRLGHGGAAAQTLSSWSAPGAGSGLGKAGSRISVACDGAKSQP